MLLTYVSVPLGLKPHVVTDGLFRVELRVHQLLERPRTDRRKHGTLDVGLTLCADHCIPVSILQHPTPTSLIDIHSSIHAISAVNGG